MFKKPFFQSANQNRANERITALQVRVIGADSQQLGVMATAKALELAKNQGLDLVEVSAKAEPPVCKITDFGKFLYQKEKQARQHKGHKVEIKNIRLSFNIAANDLKIKAQRAEKFLSKGDRVRVEILLRGREKAFGDLAKRKLAEFKDNIQLPLILDQPITKQPRGFYMLLSKGK